MDYNFIFILIVVIIFSLALTVAIFFIIRLKKTLLIKDENLKNIEESFDNKIYLKTKELENSNLNLIQSIDFASIIQKAFKYHEQDLDYFFTDHFVHVKQMSKIGGDIVLLEQLNPNECILMTIDCTSHGVPGAFVSMLVKGLERQIIKEIKKLEHISTSVILQRFNYEIKYILNQHRNRSKSNVGFDGQVLYYNKKENKVKFSCARSDVIICQDGTLTRVKGDRMSIGYKDSDLNFIFKEHEYDVSKDTKIYLYSDGISSQKGGDKSLPLGHKRTISIIEKYKDYSMKEQEKLILNDLSLYKKEIPQNDDISFVGLHINPNE